MIHHIENEKIINEIMSNENLIIIDFFAEWCGPCQMLTPVLRNIDEKYGEKVEIYKVDVDENQSIAMRYGITAMPTLLFFKDGNEVERQVGYIDEDELVKLVDEFVS